MILRFLILDLITQREIKLLLNLTSVIKAEPKFDAQGRLISVKVTEGAKDSLIPNCLHQIKFRL